MTDENELRKLFQVSTMIYFSVIIGLLFLFVVTIFIIQDGVTESGKELDKFFIFIVPVFGFLMMFFSRMIYRKTISVYNPDKSLHQKIVDFRNYKIITWAFIESACILSLVALLLTANYLYAVVFIFLLGYFLFMKPTRESLITDMRLTTEESGLILKS